MLPWIVRALASVETRKEPKHLIVTAEAKLWRCVESGEQPQLFGIFRPQLRPKTITAA